MAVFVQSNVPAQWSSVDDWQRIASSVINRLQTAVADGLHVSVKDFGALGDGVSDDSAAFTKALAYLKTKVTSGYGYTSGAPRLIVPCGVYYLGTTTLDIDFALIIEGDGSAGATGGASVLKWAANATGIRVQRHNTSGATAATGTGTGGDGTTIRNLFLKGGFSSTEGEYHGIHLRATATVRDVFIDGFQGDGVYVQATIGGGVGLEGAANLLELQKVFVQNCRNGLYTEGGDANAGSIIGFSAIACRQWGIWEKSFLGNTYVASHVAANARNSSNNGSSLAASFVTYGGNRYTVIRGQEVGASTNAPSGTTANNTWWIYVEAGGTTVGVPAWSSGMTVRAGGGYLVEGLSNKSVFLNPYAEIDQYSQFDQNTSIFGHSFLQGHTRVTSGAAFVNRLASMGASLNGFRYFGNIECLGDLNVDNVIALNGLGADLSAGLTYRVNGTQVVTARQTGTAANATDLATAITLVNDLKAKLIAHGLIS